MSPKTPAGFDCKFFFGDYYRGRQREECRLVTNSPGSIPWSPDLCRTCPVPAILRANACPNMILKANVTNYFFGFKHRVNVTAFCKKNDESVLIPEIGCGTCHTLPEIFDEFEKR